MEHEDGPNFGYAYGGAPSAGASSWNPALRPDHEEEQLAAPVVKPVESSPETPAQAEEIPGADGDDEEELPTAPAAAPAIPAHVTKDALDREPNSDDDFFDRYGGGDFAQSAPHAPANEIHANGVNGAETDDLTNGMQGLNVEDEVPFEEQEEGHG